MKTFLILALLLVPGAAEAAVAGVPACDDARLVQQVSGKISEYQKENPPKSILAQREQLLLLKEMKSFEEIPADNFTNEQDYATAKRLIEIKINNNVTASNVRLCKNMGKGLASKLYLIIYAYRGEYRIAITNFAPDQSEFEAVY